MRAVDCVGALIKDERGRVYVHRRTAVTVDGDLRRPRLEAGKHDASAWVVLASSTC
jgi:hypothetical protein